MDYHQPCPRHHETHGKHQRLRTAALQMLLPLLLLFLLSTIASATAADVIHDWTIATDTTIRPVLTRQPVITINGQFPGPLINATTNDLVRVNVHNTLTEPFLMTWNGVQQRLDSWQDGVSGTNCAIPPGGNWTYEFQVKDQIGTFWYGPSTRFQRAAGGYGPLRVNNRAVIAVPFVKPEKEVDLLIGDWYSFPYQYVRQVAAYSRSGLGLPQHILINGKAPYGNSWGKPHEVIEVESGKTYRLRIANVGTSLSFNFRVQDHALTVVETEGSYTNQITLSSLDIHVGQSYSILLTASKPAADYYIAATPTQINTTATAPGLVGLGILHYKGSPSSGPRGDIPPGPPQLDKAFSVSQAKSIRWNMTAGAARPNPQGTFNVNNVTISQTFVLKGSRVEVGGNSRFAVNNVSYLTPETPLKLADYYANGTGVYRLDEFPVDSVRKEATLMTSVVTGIHKGWLQVVFRNDGDMMDSWHLDGFGFYVVGFGDGEWSPDSRSTYNILDPVVRSTVQVYPRSWTAVYAYLDNPGMWNLRSQRLENWYLGQEIYVRVYDPDPNPAKERPPPDNLLRCGIVGTPSTPVAPTISPAPAVSR